MGDTRTTVDKVKSAASVFGLRRIVAVRYLAEGLLNHSWRVTAGDRVVVIKQLVALSGARAAWVLARLSEFDTELACVRPLVTPSGDFVVNHDGSYFYAFPWIDGNHRHGSDLSAAESETLGRRLGSIHAALGTSGAEEPRGEPRTLRVRTAARGFEAVESMRGYARSIHGSHLGTFAVEALEVRLKLIDRFAGLRPVGWSSSDKFGVVHGDFQHLNILWNDGRIAGIVDWDRMAAAQSLADEVARSIAIQFGLGQRGIDIGRARSFVRGYRDQQALAGDTLASALDRIWWRRLTDVWQLEFRAKQGSGRYDLNFTESELLLQWWSSNRELLRDRLCGAYD